MEFDYCFVETSIGKIEIDDIFDTVLKVTNALQKSWLLKTRSILGKVEIVELGPYLESDDEILASDNFVIHKYTMDCDDRKQIKVINNFLNKSSDLVDKAEEVSRDYFFKVLEEVLNAVRQEATY